ncbi:4-alpha-glucanotransferase [Xanthobacter sp. KR7-65]|uniref:4-alpha-glucanotransferase n=1 Tax=Xanthobacter sp. KR7-65 TaxID=3156612 RepID=UPI0032B42696
MTLRDATRPAVRPLLALARAAGLSPEWVDAFDVPQQVPEETLGRILIALGHPCGSAAEIAAALDAIAAPRKLPRLITCDAGGEVILPGVPPAMEAAIEDGGAQRVSLRPHREGAAFTAPETAGYYPLHIGAESVRLAVAPSRAPSVEELTGSSRAFGAIAQVYGLQRAGDGGIGDLGAVADLAERLAASGAHALALSPLHALFAAAPERYGPYAPSSRLALNPFLADPAAVFSAEDVAAASSPEAAALEALPLIDWPRAGLLKLAVLRGLFARLESRPGPAAAFAAFAAQGDADLGRHALFEALHAHALEAGLGGDWRRWPQGLRSPDSADVRAFAQEHGDDVRFHLFLQWLAAESLASAQARAEAAGMGIGLITDLAVGLDPSGSEAWSRPGDLLAGLTVGAPPDLLARDGQNWGLTASSPTALSATGFAPFIATLRAALRHAGGVRIDHVLGLRRLWLVPDGRPASDGAYLAYPFEDLLRLLALEAHLHGAIAIGEDLGTVPEGLREAMETRGVLGMRVLPFERTREGAFHPPGAWTPAAVAMTSTHDLPTAAGWWRGNDLAWRARITQTSVPAKAEAQRAAERAAFNSAALACGVPPSAEDALGPDDAADAAIAFVAATSSALALIPLEDLLAQEEAPNLPGTWNEHPNWRRRTDAPLSDLMSRPRVVARLACLNRSRAP